jgi:hypothetical protein
VVRRGKVLAGRLWWAAGGGELVRCGRWRCGGGFGSAGSLWRLVCTKAEEGRTCWLRAKGNGETMEVGLWGKWKGKRGERLQW